VEYRRFLVVGHSVTPPGYLYGVNKQLFCAAIMQNSLSGVTDPLDAYYYQSVALLPLQKIHAWRITCLSEVVGLNASTRMDRGERNYV
jgi:hypothetical protein